MKNLLIYSFLVFVLFNIISCKKRPNRFSDWKINETAYRSNNVTFYEERGTSGIKCHDSEHFSLGWYTSSGLPNREGKMWRIANGMQGTVGLDIYYQGSYYIVAPNEVKFISSRIGEDGGIEFVLEPVWYVNYANPADSVLVEGVFRRP